MLVKTIRSHFLDSGSFGLKKKAAEFAKEQKCSLSEFYDSEHFYTYQDQYISFINSYKDILDYYANIDVIGDPELSFRNQLSLEKKGLHPIPVVHFLTDIDYLKKYIDIGHQYIAIGGLVGNLNKPACPVWLGQVFKLAKEANIRLHAFGVSSVPYLVNYPWFSADAASWALYGGMGFILAPIVRRGQFCMDRDPLKIKTSTEVPQASKKKEIKYEGFIEEEVGGAPSSFLHLKTLHPHSHVRKNVEDWLKEIDIPIGSDTESGVLSHYTPRQTANVRYFHRLEQHIQKQREFYYYFSGYASGDAKPEIDLKEKASLMLTFYDYVYQFPVFRERFRNTYKRKKKNATRG